MNFKNGTIAEDLFNSLQGLMDVAASTGNGYAINMSIINQILAFSKIVVVPLATAIIAILMLQAVLETQEQLYTSGMTGNTATLRMVGWMCFKVSVAYMLVKYVPDFLQIIIFESEKIVTSAISNSIGGGTSIQNYSVDEIGKTLCISSGHDTLHSDLSKCKINFIDGLGVWLMTFLSGLVAGLATVVIDIVQFSRLISLYTLTALSPLPCAFLMSKQHSHIGYAFLRTYIAVAITSAVLIITLNVFVLLAGQIPADVSSANAWAWYILTLGAIEITAIIGASALAKRLLSAT